MTEDILNRNYKIYVHINKTNGKMYIGQTCMSTNLRWRKDGSGYKPKNGTTYFWNAIKKYGWNNFKHIILFENLSENMANIIEAELIKKYHTQNRLYGYNIKYGGNNHTLHEETKYKLSVKAKERMHNISDEKMKEIGNKISKANSGKNNGFYGKCHTEETKQKMKQNHHQLKGVNHPMYNYRHSEDTRKRWSELRKGKNLYSDNPNAKAVEKYDKKDNIYIETFSSIKEAAESVGVTPQTIMGCCKGRLHTAGGYIWKYVKTNQNNKEANNE